MARKTNIVRLHQEVDAAVAGLARTVNQLVSAAHALEEQAKAEERAADEALVRAGSARSLASGAIRRADKISDLIS